MRIDPNEVVISDRINPDEVEVTPQQPKQPDSFLSRVGTGIMDPIVGAAQIAEKIPGVVQARKWLTGSDTSMADVVRERDAAYHAPEGIDAARIVGNIANPVSWAGGGAGAGRAALQGAFQSVLQPVNPDQDFATQKATQAGIGAAGGAVLGKAMQALTPTAEARFLLDRKVPLTYGQMLGEPIQKLENTLAKVPYVGAPLRARQQEALESWQALTRRQALPPAAPPSAAETVDDVQKAFNNAYSSALNRQAVNLAKVTTNDVLEPVVKQFRGSVSSPQIQQVGELVSRVLDDLPKGPMTAQAAHDAEIALKREAARLMKSSDPAGQEYGRFVGAVSDNFKNIWRGQLSSKEQEVLQGIDGAYSRYVPIRKASTVTDATLETPEAYTPKMLLRAARQQDRTLGKSNYLETPQGKAAAAGKAVMENGPPAASTGSGIGALASGALGHLLGADPVTLATIAAGGAGYGTKTGQKLMVGSLPAQRALIEALRRSAPSLVRQNSDDQQP